MQDGIYAGLSGGEHETLILDSAGAYEYFPMSFSGGSSEGRGDADYVGACICQQPVEFGKAQIVADG